MPLFLLADVSPSRLSCCCHLPLQLSAAEASAAYRDLLATCRQLGEGLRGVDLLAGRVAAVRAAVEALEAQVEAVAAGAGGGRWGHG